MTLMIVDGNSIANRAFFGIRPLTAPDGTPTNAIYGFLTILYRLKSTYNPDIIAVTFDVHAPTFRHRSYDFYKAQRKGMPEDLRAQMPVLKDILEKMNISIYEKEGYEADDILGTASSLCTKVAEKCIVVTGDRDSLQLVNENTSVCLIKTSEDILYTTQRFIDEYGFEPAHIVDLKALQGDSSDNIPGVAGVGEKTARDLISKYSTIDYIYKNIDALDIKDNLKNKLLQSKDNAYISYWLATIFKEVPINISLDVVQNKLCYQPGLFSTLKNLGLNKVINQWKIPEEALVTDIPTADDILPDDITITSDIKSLFKEGFSGKAFDTTIAQYLINPLAKEYSNNVSYSYLSNKLDELNMSSLFYDIEMPLAKVLASMEKEGITVDRRALQSFDEELAQSIEILEQTIYFQAGKEFNINSPKQLGNILFDELNLPDTKKRSTSAEVLDNLRQFNTIVDDILDYRELSKLKNTYTDGLQNYISEDGKIHTTFQQTVTATGRLSSANPNLQNIPIRKELGSKLREMFIASPGNVLIDADYSQIELRLLAHISNDSEMIDVFNSGEDLHRATASKVFNIPYEKVTSVERSRAKAVNFGIIYGMSAFSLANDLHVTNSEAKAYMDSYFAKFKGVAEYMNSVVEQAKLDGYVTTLFNRRRDIPELRSSNFNIRQFGQRVALNMPIQGTAADIIKLAMIKTFDELSNTNAKLILQVHDELIIECPEAEIEKVSDIIKKSMENVVQYKVPLLVEVGFGKNWAQAH